MIKTIFINLNAYKRNILLILISLILLILCYFNFFNSKKETINSFQKQNERTIDGAIISFQNFFIEREGDLRILRDTLYKSQNGSLDIAQSIFYDKDGKYETLAYVSANGSYKFKVFKQGQLLKSNILEDYGDFLKLSMEKAISTKEIVYSDFFKAKDGKLKIAIIQPVIDKYSESGMVIGIFDCEELGNRIIFNRFKNSGDTIFALNKDGLRVFTIHNKYIGTNVFKDNGLLNEITRKNYTSMAKGEHIDGEHYSFFEPSHPNSLMKNPIKRYIISKPVYLNNQFKFSIAIVTFPTITTEINLLEIRQIILFILLNFIFIYFMFTIYIKYKENKLLLESLNKSNESEKQTIEFFCNMSHELRTPLTIILSGLQVIYKKYNNEIEKNNEFKKLYERIRQNAFRLLKLVNNLLEMSKIDSGFITCKLRNVDVVKLVEDIISSTALYARQKKIELLFDTELEEQIVAMDSDGIEKIILNLLSNAIKFTPENGKILVTLFTDNNYVKISVKDSGIGIPEDKLKFIFERFAQVDNSLRRIAEGTGLGLSIVKAIVGLHNGKIEVISHEGSGSEFIVHIPNKTVSNDNISQIDGINREIISDVNIEFSDL